MAFTINPALPPQVWPAGHPVTIQLGMAADSTPSPSGWTATGLPSGLTISAAGKITGTPLDPGVYDVVVTATGSGPVTDTLAFQIGIAERLGLGVIPGGAVEIDIDIRTGLASVLGVTPAETGETLYGRVGDVLQLAIGITKAGELQELDLVSLDVAVKLNEPESVLAASDGVFHRVGYGAGTRWLTSLPLSRSGLVGALSDNEGDAGTYATFLTEVQAAWNYWPPGADPEEEDPEVIIRTSQSIKLVIERDWIAEPS